MGTVSLSSSLVYADRSAFFKIPGRGVEADPSKKEDGGGGGQDAGADRWSYGRADRQGAAEQGECRRGHDGHAVVAYGFPDHPDPADDPRIARHPAAGDADAADGPGRTACGRQGGRRQVCRISQYSSTGGSRAFAGRPAEGAGFQAHSKRIVGGNESSR